MDSQSATLAGGPSVISTPDEAEMSEQTVEVANNKQE
jgi:hypothetical protein